MKLIRKVITLITIFSLINVQAKDPKNPNAAPKVKEFLDDYKEFSGIQKAKWIEKLFKTGKLTLKPNTPNNIKTGLNNYFSKLKTYTNNLEEIKVSYIGGTYFITSGKSVTYFQIINTKKNLVKINGKKVKFDLTQSPQQLYEKYFQKKRTTSFLDLFIDDAHAAIFFVALPIIVVGAVFGCLTFCNNTGKLPGDLDGYLSHVKGLKNKCDNDTSQLYAGNIAAIGEAITAASELDKIMDEAEKIFKEQGRVGEEFKDIYSCEQLTFAHIGKTQLIYSALKGVGETLDNKKNEYLVKTKEACKAYKETYTCLDNLRNVAERNEIFTDENRKGYKGHFYGTYAGEYEGYIEEVRKAMKDATQSRY